MASSSDPVPDIEPITGDPSTSPEQPKPSVSSANSFFIYLLIMLAFLIFYRLSWEGILMMAETRIPPSTMQVLFYIWMLPVAGILASIVTPSIGATTFWILGATIVAAVPFLLSTVFVTLFGNRRGLTVAAP